MTITASALRELHRNHRQLTDLRDQLQRGPKQLRAAEGSVHKMELDLEQTKEAQKKIRLKADEKQLQLKEREDRIEDLQNKLNSCGSNREYQALKEQMAADDQANSVLADEILEALERLDELTEKLAVATADLERVRAEAEKVIQRVASDKERLESELIRVQDELAQAEAALPGDFRREYDRITKARGENAMAEIDGECCGGCYQLLSPQTMNELYLSKLVFCKSCGCLLYLPEDRLPGAGSE